MPLAFQGTRFFEALSRKKSRDVFGCERYFVTAHGTNVVIPAKSLPRRDFGPGRETIHRLTDYSLCLLLNYQYTAHLR